MPNSHGTETILQFLFLSGCEDRGAAAQSPVCSCLRKSHANSRVLRTFRLNFFIVSSCVQPLILPSITAQTPSRVDQLCSRFVALASCSSRGPRSVLSFPRPSNRCSLNPPDELRAGPSQPSSEDRSQLPAICISGRSLRIARREGRRRRHHRREIEARCGYRAGNGKN